MRILGIDPGTATLGFGVIDVEKSNRVRVVKFGVIKTAPTSATGNRLNEIAQDLREIYETFKPDICAVEEIFFGKNVSTAIHVAQARGVVLQTLSEAGYPIFEYNPGQIKLALTGDGKADKQQIQKMVTLILGLSSVPHPDDAADALAIALCHAHTAAYAQTS